MRSDSCISGSRTTNFDQAKTTQTNGMTKPMAGALCVLAIGLAACLALGAAGFAPDQASAITKRPANTAVLKAKSTTAKITLTWKRTKKISGYQIKFATNKKMRHATTKRITKASKTRTTLRATPGKTYWVQIRTYKKTAKTRIYSKWSKRLKIRVPKSTSLDPCVHTWAERAITKYVVTSPAWEEQIAKGSVYFCNGCNAAFESSTAWIAHSDQMLDSGDKSHDSYRGPEVIYETIKHPEEGHVEVVGHELVCSKCGEIVK